MRKFIAVLLTAAFVMLAMASVSWGQEVLPEMLGGTWEMLGDLLGGTWE